MFLNGAKRLCGGARRVAACKAKIRNIKNEKILDKSSEQIIETFDKR